MNRVKWILGCLSLVLFLFMGWIFQVQGEEHTISATFQDHLEEIYFTNSRQLDITLIEGEISEDVICNVNGEEIFIDWDNEEKGKIIFEENGWYKVKLIYHEEEIVFPEFCIDKSRPTKPEVTFDAYTPGEWSKDDIKIKVSGSKAVSDILEYEYKTEESQWKKIKENHFILSKSYVGKIEIRSVSNAGLKSESVMYDIKLWKENPKNITLKINKENENGWYTKPPKITIELEKDSVGPEITVNYEVFSEEEKETKVYKNQIPEFSKDGKYTLTWWTQDQLGHKSKKEVKEGICIDQTKPEIKVFGDVQGSKYRNKKQTLQIQMLDKYIDIEKSDIKTTGKKEKIGDKIQVLFEEDGRQNCEIKAVDQAGNQVTEKISEFVLDKAAPKIQIAQVDAFHSYRTKVVPLISWNDINLDARKCTAWIDGKVIHKNITSDHQLKIEIKEDGHHTLEAFAQDYAGNTVKNKMAFTVNQKGSSIRLLTKNLIGKKINQGKIRLQFQVDNIDPYFVEKFQLNDKQVDYVQKKNVVTMTESLREDGNYKIKFAVKDMSGNKNEYNEENEFYYDGTPPEILILGVRDGKAYEGKRKIQIKTQRDDDKITRIFVNGKEEKDHTNNQKILFKKGKYRIKVEGKDQVGNVASKEISFEIIETNILLSMKEQIKKMQMIPEKIKDGTKRTPVLILSLLILSVLGTLFVFVKEQRKK
ncbi:MAG: hypothetical protein PHD56_01955 [Anaerostipes sp.]|nr:hypothetical protein [Anaerostipes sp.]